MLTPIPVLTIRKRMPPAQFFASILLCLVGAACSPSGTRSLVGGDQLSREGKHQQAIEQLKKAANEVPELYRAKAWNHLGMAYHRAGQIEQATNAYQRAIQLNPGFIEARFNLGSALLDLNNLPACITQLTAYLDRNPNNATAWLLRGKAYLRANQFEIGRAHV